MTFSMYMYSALVSTSEFSMVSTPILLFFFFHRPVVQNGSELRTKMHPTNTIFTNQIEKKAARKRDLPSAQQILLVDCFTGMTSWFQGTKR